MHFIKWAAMLCVVSPIISHAQLLPVRIEVKITDPHPVSAVFMQRDGKSVRCPVTGNTVVITDTLPYSMMGSFIIQYDKGWTARRNMFSVYLAPGNISLTMSAAPDSTALEQINVTGPVLSMEYAELLEKPVFQYGRQINALKERLENTGEDTVKLQQELKQTLLLSFNTARKYIQTHKESPLSLVALAMMGHGDPNESHPTQELQTLFLSLAKTVRESEVGRKYESYLNRMLKG